MIAFVVLALVFTVLTLLTFVLDGLLDSLVPDLGADGLISSTSLCAALAGAGYGGWIGLGALELSLSGALLVSVAAAAVVLAATGAALQAVRRAETPQETLEDLVGREGRAVTGAPTGLPFEFMVPYQGQPLKIGAVAGHDVAQGDELVVREVLSSTRLVVDRPGGRD